MDDPKVAIQLAVKQAMIEKNAVRRDVLRGAMSAFKQVEIDERKTLTPEEAVTILQKEVKKGRESIDEARKAGREDIVTKVEEEIAILGEFLPRQLSRDEIVTIVDEAIAQTGVASAKEMGKLMAVLMPKVKGLADGALVNTVVRERLQ